jgi:hypothetical protein
MDKSGNSGYNGGRKTARRPAMYTEPTLSACIVLYNSGTSGMLSLTDMKFTFAENPGAVEDLFYVSKETLEAVLQGMNTVPEQYFKPTKLAASTVKEVVVKGKFYVTVTTSSDVAAVRVDGKLLTTYSTNYKRERVWTALVNADATPGTQNVSVVAYNSDGLPSETTTVTITVKSVQQVVIDVVNSVVNKLKQWANERRA